MATSADALQLQDGLHNIITSPDFQAALRASVEQTFAPIIEPQLLEEFRRFISKGRRNDSRSYAVGSEPPAANIAGRVKILERDENRVYALIQNLSPQAVVNTPVDAASNNAAAANNVSIVPPAGQTAFITGFEITGDGATAGSVIVVTLTGVPGGPLSYELTIPAGAGVPLGQPLIVEFPQPIPATGVGVTITLSVPSFGAGNVNAAAVIHGFTQLQLGPTIYVGGRQVTTGVANDPSGGIQVAPGQTLRLDADVGELWAIATAPGADVRVLDVCGSL